MVLRWTGGATRPFSQHWLCPHRSSRSAALNRHCAHVALPPAVMYKYTSELPIYVHVACAHVVTPLRLIFLLGHSLFLLRLKMWINLSNLIQSSKSEASMFHKLTHFATMERNYVTQWSSFDWYITFRASMLGMHHFSGFACSDAVPMNRRCSNTLLRTASSLKSYCWSSSSTSDNSSFHQVSIWCFFREVPVAFNVRL